MKDEAGSVSGSSIVSLLPPIVVTRYEGSKKRRGDGETRGCLSEPARFMETERIFAQHPRVAASPCLCFFTASPCLPVSASSSSSFILHPFLDPSHIRSPNVFVHLKLQAHAQPAPRCPFRQFLKINLIPCGRNQNC